MSYSGFIAVPGRNLRRRPAPELGKTERLNASMTARWFEDLQHHYQKYQKELLVWGRELTNIIQDGNLYVGGLPQTLGSVAIEEAPWLTEGQREDLEALDREMTRGIRIQLLRTKDPEPPSDMSTNPALPPMMEYFYSKSFQTRGVLLCCLLFEPFRQNDDGRIVMKFQGNLPLVKIAAIDRSVIAGVELYFKGKCTIEQLLTIFQAVEPAVSLRDVAHVTKDREKVGQLQMLVQCYRYSLEPKNAIMVAPALRVGVALGKTMGFDFTCYDADLSQFEKTQAQAEKISGLVGVNRDEGKFSSRALGNLTRRTATNNAAGSENTTKKTVPVQPTLDDLLKGSGATVAKAEKQTANELDAALKKIQEENAKKLALLKELQEGTVEHKTDPKVDPEEEAKKQALKAAEKQAADIDALLEQAKANAAKLAQEAAAKAEENSNNKKPPDAAVSSTNSDLLAGGVNFQYGELSLNSENFWKIFPIDVQIPEGTSYYDPDLRRYDAGETNGSAYKVTWRPKDRKAIYVTVQKPKKGTNKKK